MNKAMCMNLLRYLDGIEQPTRELIQYAKGCGNIEKLHGDFRVAMKRAGWNDGGSRTIEDALLTPHVRDWDLLVGAQRQPLRALMELKIEAQWEATEEPTEEPTEEGADGTH